MFGEIRERHTRLLATALAETLLIKVANADKWRSGDEIAIFTSSNDWRASEHATILSIT